MLWLLIAQALASADTAPPPPRLTGPVNTLFSVDDYPKEAIRHGWQGTVVADISVSPEGKVSACRIAQSSGHEVLDNKTCQILTLRARFVPAKDSQGRPTWDALRTPPIQWRLAR